MTGSPTTSESLMGSLCREIDALRNRCSQLIGELARCRQESLRLRLQGELEGIRLRRQELRVTLGVLQGSGLGDPLGLDFLSELVGRPLPG
jgi:hypothetical protein